jgi:purine catabolism regulator
MVAQLVLASASTHPDHLAVAAERLRGILGLAMSQQHRPSLAQISQTNLVAAVVEGRDQRQVRRLWAQNGFAPDTAAAVVIVSGFERGSDGMNLLRALRAQNPQVMTHQREGTMILLAPLAGDPLRQRAAVLHTAAQAMATTPLFGAAGPLVWDPAEAHTSFSEAEALLRHQPPGRGELRDAMDAFEVRALRALDEGTVLATYSEALLGNVLRWDRAHGTALVATLQAWFATGCHTTLAAQHLHIERQTLHKRLNKVFELLDGDPRRTGRLFALHLAVKHLAA